MADQLTSDELRQVLAEWLRPMRPKHRQKILGLAGLFEAVIARAEAAEAEVVDLHRQLAEMAAAMEEIEDERLALLARVAELEAASDAQGWRPVTEKPEPDQEVEIVIEATFDDYGPGGWTSYGYYFAADYPTGWRPLPPAPQETE